MVEQGQLGPVARDGPQEGRDLGVGLLGEDGRALGDRLVSRVVVDPKVRRVDRSPGDLRIEEGGGLGGCDEREAQGDAAETGEKAGPQASKRWCDRHALILHGFPCEHLVKA
ncbi:hypothetical protein D3C86_1765010 [compost metagenome]